MTLYNFVAIAVYAYKSNSAVKSFVFNLFIFALKDIQECSSAPCLNNGICKEEVNGYACLCTAGYTGINCQTRKLCFSFHFAQY